jgi:hypothetical protein
MQCAIAVKHWFMDVGLDAFCGRDRLDIVNAHSSLGGLYPVPHTELGK